MIKQIILNLLELYLLNAIIVLLSITLMREFIKNNYLKSMEKAEAEEKIEDEIPRRVIYKASFIPILNIAICVFILFSVCKIFLRNLFG